MLICHTHTHTNREGIACFFGPRRTRAGAPGRARRAARAPAGAASAARLPRAARRARLPTCDRRSHQLGAPHCSTTKRVHGARAHAGQRIAAGRAGPSPPSAAREGVAQAAPAEIETHSLHAPSTPGAARSHAQRAGGVPRRASRVEGPPAGRARAASRPCPGQVCWPAVQLRGSASRS